MGDKNYMFVNDIYIFDNEDGFSKERASDWEKVTTQFPIELTAN